MAFLDVLRLTLTRFRGGGVSHSEPFLVCSEKRPGAFLSLPAIRDFLITEPTRGPDDNDVSCDRFNSFRSGYPLRLFTSLGNLAAGGDITWPTPGADDDDGAATGDDDGDVVVVGDAVEDDADGDNVSLERFKSFRSWISLAAPELFISLENLQALAE